MTTTQTQYVTDDTNEKNAKNFNTTRYGRLFCLDKDLSFYVHALSGDWSKKLNDYVRRGMETGELI